MRRVAFFVVLAALAGCNRPPAPTSATTGKSVPAVPPDPWVLTTLDGRDPEPAYLSNGLIGVRIGRNAGGLAPDGKPLGFFMIDEYEGAGEEKIRTLSNPLLVAWAVGNKLFSGQKEYDFVRSGGTPLDPRGGTDYRQALDLRTGVLTTEWRQAGVQIRCETVLHPNARALGQRWTLKADRDTSFSARTLDYGGANDPQAAFGSDDKAGIFLSVSPRRAVSMIWRADKETAAKGASAAVEGFRVQEGSLKAGETATFERTLSFGAAAKTPIKVADDGAVGRAAAKPYEFDEIVRTAKAAWTRRWAGDIEIDGPIEDQQAIRSFLFYLRGSIAPGVRRAIAPMALSSDIYSGHVFWDADIWTFPALMLTDPDLAQQIGNYRLDLAPAAQDNFRTWLAAGKPTGGKMVAVPNAMEYERGGAKYPWESSVTGKETVPGPSRFEDHITGSVNWSLAQGEALGNGSAGRPASPADTIPNVASLGARFYQARSVEGSNGLEIRGTMSPDENHTGDNDLYTNLLAMWLTNGRKWPATPTYKLPKDGKGFLTYDGDTLRGYKQAAAILACYPLQYPPAEAQTRAMLERFGPKTNENGPAMTDSIEGLLWARIGEPKRGYDEWRKGWVDFTRHPLLTFSEKRRSARTYFATGAGGALQTVLYGFAGLRLDDQKAPGALWSRTLPSGKVLSAKPSLPPAWKRIRLKGIVLPDGRYDLDVTNATVTATKRP